jgi:TolB-like protein
MKHPNDTLPAFLLLSALLLPGCSIPPAEWSRAQRAYDRGDVTESINLAAEALRRNHGYEDAVVFLLDVLPRSYDDHYQRAQRAEGTNDWPSAYEHYRTIQRLSSGVATLRPQPHPETGERIAIPTRDVGHELATAANNAAEHHYQRALSLEEEGRTRDAAREYTRAMEIVPDYRDAAARYEGVRVAAVRRIAVMPFETRVAGAAWAVGDMVTDHIIHEVMSDPANLEFLDLVSRDAINLLMEEHGLVRRGVVDPGSAPEAGRVLGVHTLVYGNVVSLATEGPGESSEIRQHSGEITESGRTMTIRAVVRITTRRAAARISANYRSIDAQTGSILTSGQAQAEEEGVIRFCTFQGNERAVPRSTRRLCTHEPDDALPLMDELVQRAAEKVAKSVAAEIVAYFR